MACCIVTNERSVQCIPDLDFSNIPEEGINRAEQTNQPRYRVIAPSTAVLELHEHIIRVMLGRHNAQDDNNSYKCNDVKDTWLESAKKKILVGSHS